MNRLKDKVAIVTGAAGGIGLSIASLFYKEGAKVVATDVQAELLESEMNALNAGNNILAMPLDVSSEEGWKIVVQRTMEQFGKIDILVNNAGIVIHKGILETELKDWNKVLSINTTGTFLGIREVIPHMQTNGGGSIVNMSSIAALISGESGDAGAAAYSASKGAVRSFTKHVAQHFAKYNIRSNSIHPGPIYTPIMKNVGVDLETAKKLGNVPLPPHIGEPDDIAYGALYLASDEAKFVTGDELVIDGGVVTR